MCTQSGSLWLSAIFDVVQYMPVHERLMYMDTGTSGWSGPSGLHFVCAGHL